MKETGIIMSGDHPQLIIAGKKTMTRRTYGLEKINEMPELWEWIGHDQAGRWSFRNKYSLDVINLKCPYGQVGDRLWVRETWWKPPEELWPYMLYKAAYYGRDDWPQDWGIKWKPSIHMFRKDSRLLLDITGLRAERLQEITRHDTLLEGVGCNWQPDSNQFATFQRLWDSLNAKRGYGWETNPWVWEISFKEIRGQTDA